jgi:hypothetical protein
MIAALKHVSLVPLVLGCAAPVAPAQSSAAPGGGQAGIRFGDPVELAYDAPFFAGAHYDPDVPSPDAILGQAHGSRLSRHDEIVACFRALGVASPRVVVETYGHTHEGRELVYAVITSPANHARLDAILADHACLYDPRGLADAEAVLARTVPIAWMGYSIHGDELSGSDAAVALGYHLAASTDADVAKLLDDLVVVVDPCENPDGRQRILTMVEQAAGYTPNLDYASMQRGRWPYGRGNHYLFDLNRDWMAGTQPETRARWAAVARFHPQLFVDAHEMGSLDTFLTYPQERPWNLDFPAQHGRWQTVFAADVAAAFDAQGWSYYTREWADGWAPFYTDAWASLTGAVGILYEQASTSGFPLRRASGELLTYRESVHHQATASLANLRTLAARGSEILANYLANQRVNVAADTPGNDRAFVLVPGANAGRERELLAALLDQKIEVLRADAAFSGAGAESVLGPRADAHEFPAGALIVPARQPRAQLVKAFLAFDPRLDAAALRAEREELEQAGATKIYDLTAWSLPHALALDAWWCDAPDVAATPVERVSLPEAGRPGEDGDAVAWVVGAGDDGALVFAARALEGGVQVHAADRAFTLGPRDTGVGRAFPRGSFLVRRRENPRSEGELERLLAEAAAAGGVELVRAGTSRSPDDGPDLGGGHFRLLARPRVAMLANSPVAYDTYGHLWHQLDRVLGVPFSLLDAQAFSSADLRRYNVLIVPPGAGAFVGEHAEELGRWAADGGTLLAIGDSAGAATGAELSKVKLRRDALEHLNDHASAVARERAAFAVEIDEALVWDGPAAEPPGDAADAAEEGAEHAKPDAEKAADAPTAEDDARARIFAPYGVALRAELNPRAWITAGVSPLEPAVAGAPLARVEIPVFFSGDRVFLAADGVAVRLAPAPKLRLGGLVWPEARARIADSAWLTVEPKGRGQVILFACMPAYRGYHAATARLFGNAVILGPGLGASQPIGW